LKWLLVALFLDVIVVIGLSITNECRHNVIFINMIFEER